MELVVLAEKSRSGRDYILTLSCADTPGLVFAVSGFLVQHSCNILQNQQFDDRLTGLFFMRVHFESEDSGTTLTDLQSDFAHVAGSLRMDWQLSSAQTPTRVLIMVSRFDHCLNDLLYRHKVGALNIDIPAIVSNHPDLRALADSYRIAYHHIPVTPQTKAEAEGQLLELVAGHDIDIVVLARYMQVLSDDLCTKLRGKAMNIHHSFLPSFKGGKPYHQAHERGVKLIGATAHYVTTELDEGQIIEQDVERVEHTMDPQELVAIGRDVEARVLARALKWHSEHRVLLNGNRTIVFR
ncbi:MAG: formyltetrahydrofolate deformylase [Pseudonocardiales bacterium]|jgi:formyltetrahydrofolate deformylase|nr:formyltetrahydrofolate deformylase [Pseudonocardiales bacterium]